MQTGRRNRNLDVAQLLETIADILEVKGEQPFRTKAYRNAARRIEALREPVETLHEENRLREIQGVGEALEKKIAEYLETGRLVYLERLQAEFPPGLVELLSVPGLGPRRARLVFDTLGIANLAELEQAAREGRLRHVAGLGEKTEENILRELERLKQRSTRQHLGRALPLAEEIVGLLRQSGPPLEAVTYAGSIRRMRDTIGDLDILATSHQPETIVARFLHLPLVLEVLSAGPIRASVLVQGGTQVDLRVVEPESWGAALVYFTGSKAHNIRLREMAIHRGWKLNEYGLFVEATDQRLSTPDEAAVYERLGMTYIPPELREDQGEIEAAMAGRLPRLVELGDLKGDLHVHSDWSDGGEPIEVMARAAAELGYEYMALTDHSKSLGVARGLDEARVREQRAVVEALNAELAPFRILHGTEMDIRRDGTLDYDDDVLAAYDYVSASVHSAMSQPEAEMTARIIRTLRNPYVHVLNHPFGRLIPHRGAYEVDMDAVLAVAAEEGVAVEINSQPSRMDLEGSWAKRAKEAGCALTISSDSHASPQLRWQYLGIASARRGWLEAGDVVNTLPLDALLERLRALRRNIGRP